LLQPFTVSRWRLKMAERPRKTSDLFKGGFWNYCFQEWDAQTGLCTILIHKHGWKRRYKFKVRRLYQPDEEIVEDEEFKESREGEAR